MKGKTQKGITLVALIITIIVLLILAVVAITAIQNDGIFSHANNAATKFNDAQINEQGILGEYEIFFNKYNWNLVNVRDQYEWNKGYISNVGGITVVDECLYVRIPVQEGETWYVWYEQEYMLGIGNGALRYENSSNELVEYLDMGKQPHYKVNPDSNVPGAVMEIPSGVSYMCVNLKFTTLYDHTETAIIAKGRNYSVKMATFGDSITEHNNRANKNWVSHLIEAIDAIYLNLGTSGYGYNANDGSFIQKLAKLPNDAELIIIYGSFNDMIESNEVGAASDVYVENADNSLAAYMNYTYDSIQTLCPNAKIAVIAPAPWAAFNPDDTTSKASQYVDVMKEICESKGIPFLDLFRNSGMTPWVEEYRNNYYYNGDGCHPNDEGQKILASKIIPFIKSVLKN